MALTTNLDLLDDLTVVSGRTLRGGFTLCAVVRNEMYFLPAFLAHYRNLGVERFIFLDDRSDDGTLEYILAQPDVIALASSYRYGDTVSSPWSNESKDVRMLYIWRTLMMERFCTDEWCLHVDMDEFVHLPEGQRFQDVVARSDLADERLVLGVMLDAYPATLSDLAAQRDDQALDLHAQWYFDGEGHLDLIRGRKRPEVIHPGARARLYWKHKLFRLYPETGLTLGRTIKRLLIRSRLGLRIPRYNSLHKPALIRWPSGARFFSSHSTDIKYSRKHLLPILHFRFTGALYRKIDMALSERSYHGGSRDHRLLQALIADMSKKNSAFLYPRSCCFKSFEDFEKSGNTMGLLPE